MAAPNFDQEDLEQFHTCLQAGQAGNITFALENDNPYVGKPGFNTQVFAGQDTNMEDVDAFVAPWGPGTTATQPLMPFNQNWPTQNAMNGPPSNIPPPAFDNNMAGNFFGENLDVSLGLFNNAASNNTMQLDGAPFNGIPGASLAPNPPGNLGMYFENAGCAF